MKNISSLTVWCVLLLLLANPMQLISGESEPAKSPLATGEAQTPAAANKENADSFSQKDAIEKLSPKADEFGARWKILLAPTTRKSNLLGRPSLFTSVSNRELFTFSENFILPRSVRSGTFERLFPVFPPMRLLQVAAIPKRMAFVVAPKDPKANPTGDILYIDSAGLWQLWNIDGGLKAWPVKIKLLNALWFDKAQLILTGHTKTPWKVLFSADPMLFYPRDRYCRLASCSDDGSIRLWDLDPESHDLWGRHDINQWFGQQIAEFHCYKPDANGQVTRGEFVAFSPYGRWLATAYQHRVDFRSPKDGQSELYWEPELSDSQRIMALRFDATGSYLLTFLEHATATKTPAVKFFLYDIDARQTKPFTGTHGVVDGRMIGDGQYVVTWDGSPELVFWDVAQRKEVATLQVAPQHVYDVAIAPSGDVIATAGDDGEVKFWKTPSTEQPEPKPLETKSKFQHPGIDLVQFSDDGKWMFTGSDDGWLKTWDAPDFCHKPEPERQQRSTSSVPIDAEGTFRSTFADGHYEEHHPDGTVKEVYPDGKVKIYKQQ